MNDSAPIADAPVKPPQRFRRTRIAVSVFFGVVAVAIVMLWWRSYSYLDYLQCQVTDAHSLSVISRGGVARFKVLIPAYLDLEPGTTVSPWDVGSAPILGQTFPQESRSSFSAHTSPEGWTVTFPHWIAAVVAGLLSAVAGLGSRVKFSLRTLLLATTLVAVVLGLICYAFP